MEIPKINKLTQEQRSQLASSLLKKARERNPHLFREPTEEQLAMIESLKQSKQ